MKLRYRKNQAALTARERARFVAAVLTLKASGRYDQYVQWHRDAGVHMGPFFFHWHREFIRRFEVDLQSIDASVTLPYWDFSVDNSPASSIWNDDFMGGDGRPADGIVTIGPFAFNTGNWFLEIVVPINTGPELRRRFGVVCSSLPAVADVNAALGRVPYDFPPYDTTVNTGFRNYTEGWINGFGCNVQMHNRVHVWVGGSMTTSTSPNDPLFFLMHAFVDKIWADWQALHPDLTSLPLSAADTINAMEPWASLDIIVTPSSVLDHHDLGYAYDTEEAINPTIFTEVDIPEA